MNFTQSLDKVLNSDKFWHMRNTTHKPSDFASPIGSTANQARTRREARSAEYRAEAARIAPFEQLARLVIERRIRLRMSQEQLAERMQTSISAISRLESGQHRPNVDTLQRLANAFGEHLIVGFEGEAGERELVSVS